MSEFAGRKLELDQEVCKSELMTNSHNKALAWNAKSLGFLKSEPFNAVMRYTKACSVAITCKDLGIMGATLASQGINLSQSVGL